MFACLQQAKDSTEEYNGVRQPENPWTRWNLQQEYELLPFARWGNALLGRALHEVSLLSPVGVAALSAFLFAAAAAELVLQFLHRDSKKELAGTKRPLLLILVLRTALANTMGRLLVLRGGLWVARTFQAGCMFVIILPVGLHNLLVLLENSYCTVVGEHQDRDKGERFGMETSQERLYKICAATRAAAATAATAAPPPTVPGPAGKILASVS